MDSVCEVGIWTGESIAGDMSSELKMELSCCGVRNNLLIIIFSIVGCCESRYSRAFLLESNNFKTLKRDQVTMQNSNLGSQ
jgi:hypothetical protein